MSRAHAILGPSSASKWIACPPSARLEMTFPTSKSEAADEGTLAHSLGELIISQRSNAITNKEFRKQLAILESNPLYNKAMYEYADGYAIYVLEQLSAAKALTPDAQLFIEQRLDMSLYVKEGFGTGDAGIVGEPVLAITDLKFGKGVQVSAIDNSQLKIYALGWLAEFDHLYDIQIIRMTIYQPRMNNISVFEMGRAELIQWAEEVLAPRAALAFEGKGEYAAGKHCQFCRAKVSCRANANYQAQIVANDFDTFAKVDNFDKLNSFTPLLTDNEITAVLARAEAFKNWVTSVVDFARAEALKGRRWPGYKLVNGRSVRKFTDATKVEKLLIKEGFDRTKIFKSQEMIGITEMEALTGKKLFDEKIAEYTVKADGAPTLVPADDKRKEFITVVDEFENLTEPDELG